VAAGVDVVDFAAAAGAGVVAGGGVEFVVVAAAGVAAVVEAAGVEVSAAVVDFLDLEDFFVVLEAEVSPAAVVDALEVSAVADFFDSRISWW